MLWLSDKAGLCDLSNLVHLQSEWVMLFTFKSLLFDELQETKY